MSLKNPVKYPVKYYSWQDNQAPQLTNVDGIIKTILKACLVTGYGSKTGAGWTALFEDAYRIVLRRPLRTGNPPDIKIENGTITGTTVRHRIVAQDNPSGLDDATELSAVNLIARDGSSGKEWHCIVTDFAFLLCYQMGRNSDTVKNNVLFVGSAKKMRDVDEDYFFTSNYLAATVNGTANNNMGGILYNNTNGLSAIYEMRRKINYTNKPCFNLNVAEKYYNNDYMAQKAMIDVVAELPFHSAITSQYEDMTTKQIGISNRPMLRYVNRHTYDYGTYPLYIPLDYWEL